jgi:hypothetical protein
MHGITHTLKQRRNDAQVKPDVSVTPKRTSGQRICKF